MTQRDPASTLKQDHGGVEGPMKIACNNNFSITGGPLRLPMYCLYSVLRPCLETFIISPYFGDSTYLIINYLIENKVNTSN